MSMIKKAARAAANAYEQVNPSDEHDAEAWTYIAREVLGAVREPDEATLSANTPLGPMHRYGQWQAMIDAMLKDAQ